MKDDSKTKKQLIHELAELRSQNAALNQSITGSILEEYFKAISENSSDIILVVDRLGTITYASPSVERILGYRPAELIGKSSLDLIVSEDKPRAIADFGRALLIKEVLIPNAFRIRHKNDTECILEGFGKNLLDNPVVAGFVMNIRDITKRKRAEEALTESEKKYRLLAEHMTDIVWIMDMDMNVTWLSPSAVKARGFSTDEIFALPLDRQLTPKSLERAVNWLGKLMRLEKDGLISEPDGILSRELEFYRKDGRTIVLDCTFQFIRDEQGKATGILSEGKDITERKKAEERYRNIFENAQEGIFQTTAKGIITANQALATILGYDSPEELMTAVTDITTQIYVNLEDRQALLKMIEEQGSVKGFETQFYKKNGSIIWGICVSADSP